MTVFPLIGPESFEPFYLTLEEALGAGCIQLLELNEQGAVSDIRLVNDSEKPVLIVEGEAIAGAKQHRIIKYENRLKDYMDHFRCIGNQLGAVFAIEGQICGIEAFGCSETYRHFHEKLVQSYALDALDKDALGKNEKERRSAPPAKARDFLKSVMKATGESYPSISLGDTVSIESKNSVGSALVYDGNILHLAVFRNLLRENLSKS